MSLQIVTFSYDNYLYVHSDTMWLRNEPFLAFIVKIMILSPYVLTIKDASEASFFKLSTIFAYI